MIYILHICNLPALLCESCGRLSKKLKCIACRECFDQLSEVFQKCYNKPLGTYIVSAFLLCGAEIALCIMALMALQEHRIHVTCSLKVGLGEQVGVTNWLYAQIGMAWLNLIFAPYIQHKLMTKLHGISGVSPGLGHVDVTKAQVKGAFLEVFWHDFGVCFYVFALGISFWWSLAGLTWLEQGPTSCDVEGYPVDAAWMGLLFFGFVICYAVLWVMYLSCMEHMRINPAGRRYDPAYAYGHGGSGSGGGSRAARTTRYSGGGHLPHRSKQGLMDAAGPATWAPPPKPGPMYAAVAREPGVQIMDYPSGPPSHWPAPCVAEPEPGYDVSRSQYRRGWERAQQPGQIMKLLACVCLDMFGNASYLIPELGEGIDIAYAPAQAIALKMLFKSNSVMGIGFLDESLPFTDVLPTATIAWVLETCYPDASITRMLGIDPEPDFPSASTPASAGAPYAAARA